MRSKLLLCAAAMVLFAVSPVSANVIFTLKDVTLKDGTQLTGYFTTNDALTDIVDLNISAVAGSLNGFNFTDVNYTFSDAVTFQLPLNSWINVDKGGAYQLRLSFGALTSSGAALTTNGSSYDWYNMAGPRIVTGGNFVVQPANPPLPAPEPATLSLMLAGAGVIGYGLRRRAKAAKA